MKCKKCRSTKPTLNNLLNTNRHSTRRRAYKRRKSGFRYPIGRAIANVQDDSRQQTTFNPIDYRGSADGKMRSNFAGREKLRIVPSWRLFRHRKPPDKILAGKAGVALRIVAASFAESRCFYFFSVLISSLCRLLFLDSLTTMIAWIAPGIQRNKQRKTFSIACTGLPTSSTASGGNTIANR